VCVCVCARACAFRVRKEIVVLASSFAQF
jgi:hypothetical protein